jgi:hypothetical protein
MFITVDIADYAFNNLFFNCKMNPTNNIRLILCRIFNMASQTGLYLEGITDTKHNKLWFGFKFLNQVYSVLITQPIPEKPAR